MISVACRAGSPANRYRWKKGREQRGESTQPSGLTDTGEVANQALASKHVLLRAVLHHGQRGAHCGRADGLGAELQRAVRVLGQHRDQRTAPRPALVAAPLHLRGVKARGHQASRAAQRRALASGDRCGVRCERTHCSCCWSPPSGPPRGRGGTLRLADGRAEPRRAGTRLHIDFYDGCPPPSRREAGCRGCPLQKPISLR